MSFGENLISLRESMHMSRGDLATLLDIPYTTLRNYETDQREPGHKLLIKIANTLNVSVDSLIGNAKNSPAPAEPETGEQDPESQELLESLVHSFDGLNIAGKRQLSEYAGMLLKEEKYAAEYPEAGKKFA